MRTQLGASGRTLLVFLHIWGVLLRTGGAGHPHTAEWPGSVQNGPPDPPAPTVACDAATFRETPVVKAAKVPQCSNTTRQYREWSVSALLLLHPNLRTVKQACTLRSKQPEVIIYRQMGMGDAGEQVAIAGELDLAVVNQMASQCSGENHVIVHSAKDEGMVRAANRMARLAQADLVVFAAGTEGGYVTSLALENAEARFSADPSLALLAMGPAPLEANFSHTGPYMVRRRELIEAGMLTTELCPSGTSAEDTLRFDLLSPPTSGTRCEMAQAMQELAFRFLLIGLKVDSQPYRPRAASPKWFKLPPPVRPCASSAPLPLTLPLLSGVARELGITLLPPRSPKPPPLRLPLRRFKNDGRGSDTVSSQVDAHDHTLVGCSKVIPRPMRVCQGASDAPRAAAVVQYFKRRSAIPRIIPLLANTQGLEVLVADDSRSDYDAFASAMGGKEGNFLVYLHNLHEIRAYNKVARMTLAPILAMLQDDDAPPGKDVWLSQAETLFKSIPQLAVLGGFRGRQDLGYMMDTRHGFMNGPKYGPQPTEEWEKKKCCNAILHAAPRSKVPFMYVYKVNMAPVLVRRSFFMQSGMFLRAMSCVGDAGIGFDFEFSIRAWKDGWRTGLYYSQFEFDIAEAGSGTHGGVQAQIRDANELHNNQELYNMYKGFHHEAGTALALKMTDQLALMDKASPYTRPTDAAAAKAFCEISIYTCRKMAGGNERVALLVEAVERMEAERKKAQRNEKRRLERLEKQAKAIEEEAKVVYPRQYRAVANPHRTAPATVYSRHPPTVHHRQGKQDTDRRKHGRPVAVAGKDGWEWYDTANAHKATIIVGKGKKVKNL